MTGIAVGSGVLFGAGGGWQGTVAIAATVVVVLLVSPNRRALLAPAIAVLIAASVGAWRGEPLDDGTSPHWVDETREIRGLVTAMPTSSGLSQQVVIAVNDGLQTETWQATAGTVCAVVRPFPILDFGDRVRIVGRPRLLLDQPTGFRAALRGRGCEATMTGASTVMGAALWTWRSPFAAARRSLSTALQRAAPGDAGALLAGLVTGDDQGLSRARKDAFLRTGTTHITAVSGSNLALLVAIATTIGTAAGWRRRLLFQVIVLTGLWGYALLVGFGPPTVRAALVASAAIVASRVGRRPDFVTLIVLAGAVMVLVEPTQLWRLSFQLSFAASLALAAVLVGRPLTGIKGWLEAGFLVAVAAQVATLPILVWTFGTISVLSLPANFLIGPLIAVAFPLAALAGVVSLLSPTAGEAVSLPARIAADLVLQTVETLGASDFALASFALP